MITGQTGLGFNPFHAVKKAAKGVAHVTTSAVKATGHGVAVGAKATAHGTVAVAKTVGHGVLKVGEFAEMIALAPVKLALRPVKSRINTLTNRRAAKIAWDARKSKTPTPAERAQARSWTKSELKKKLPHGPLLALLAGAPEPTPMQMYGYGLGMSTNLGIAPAVIAALVPVFIEILNALLKSFAKSGEAPVSIGPNGQVILPPGMDPTAVPDSAADGNPIDPATAAAEAAADGGDGGGGGGSGGGGGHGGKPNMLLIGGGIAAIVVIVMLMKPSSSAAK